VEQVTFGYKRWISGAVLYDGAGRTSLPLRIPETDNNEKMMAQIANCEKPSLTFMGWMIRDGTRTRCPALGRYLIKRINSSQKLAYATQAVIDRDFRR